MTCNNCGMPANGRLCQDCKRAEHQESYYGVPSDHMDDDEEGDDDE